MQCSYSYGCFPQLYEYCNLVHSKRCHSSAPFLVIRVADTGIQEF
ncbi:hypothetical protein [Wolbachia endosymbiont of Psylliodes chrysocephala]|nr:hypothetical protein [Wolbachia endosymbiont of Psylliodes chrysocephala]